MKKIILSILSILFLFHLQAQNLKGYKVEAKYFQADSTYSGSVDNKSGQFKWSDSENTLQFGIEGGSIDVNKELFDIFVDLNHNLIEGDIVSVTGVSGNRRVVEKTDITDAQSARNCIGIVTHVMDGWFVRVTLAGKVRGLNTSGFTEGFPLYASIVDGQITQNLPPANVYNIYIGELEVSNNDSGVINVDIRIYPSVTDLSFVNGTALTTTGQMMVWNNTTGYFDFDYNITDYIKKTQNEITHEPTGFEHPADVVVNYNSTNRTVTLTGNTTAFWRGDTIQALVSGWTSAAHTATTGSWYLYYNGTSFVWSQTQWTFDVVQIAFVNYNQFAIRESHGLMPYQTHKELHETIGTYLTAGGDLTGYALTSTTAADRRPLISQTTLMDEDNQSTEPALSTETYTNFYLSSTNTTNFTTGAADIVPLSGNNPYWNEYTGGTWNQTLMANNSYAAVWLIALPVTADAQSQAYRYLWVQPQSTSLTLSTIQSQTPSSVILGTLTNATPEIVFIGKIIIRYTAANWQLISVEKLIGNKVNQQAIIGGSYLSTVAANAPILGNGTTANPLYLDSISSNGVATQYDLKEYVKIIDLGNDSVQTLSGTSVNWDISHGKNAKITLSGNTTIALTNLVAGMSGTVFVTNPSTVYSLSFSGYTNKIHESIYLSANTVITSGSSKFDSFSWKYDGTYVWWNGGNDYK